MVRLTVRVDPSPPLPLFYHFKMEKIGPKFSHLLTVRLGAVTPPPLYGQPDRKMTVFLRLPLLVGPPSPQSI